MLRMMMMMMMMKYWRQHELGHVSRQAPVIHLPLLYNLYKQEA